jgi:hypothetical protein
VTAEENHRWVAQQGEGKVRERKVGLASGENCSGSISFLCHHVIHAVVPLSSLGSGQAYIHVPPKKKDTSKGSMTPFEGFFYCYNF